MGGCSTSASARSSRAMTSDDASEVVIRLVRSQRTGLGNEVSDDLSHLKSRPCTLHQCRADSPYQVQCSCRCCQPLHSPRPLTSGTAITGMATASCPAIISRPTSAFQFIVRRDQSAALQAMRQATGIMAGGTISAILGFSMDATMAAVSARAGLGRPSGGCGIVGRREQKVRIADGLTSLRAFANPLWQPQHDFSDLSK
jgi:hypothetical protein